MQNIAVRLSAYWEGKGCLVLPGSDLPQASLALAPRVFFRLLRPEPWRSVHFQTLQRPADARFALQPFRLAAHHEVGALLKPPVDGALTLLCGALEAVGLDPARHDLQLVESDLTHAVAGLDGSGWTVRLDAVDVGRVTYIVALADTALEPEAMEVVFGVERLAGVLEGSTAEGDPRITWGGEVSYEAVRAEEERQLATYYLETQNPDRVLGVAELLLEEAEAVLERGLVLPAYRLSTEALHHLDVAAESRGGNVDSLRARARELIVGCASRSLGERA